MRRRPFLEGASRVAAGGCPQSKPEGPKLGTARILGDLTPSGKNELRELSDTEFLLLQTSECRQSKPAGMNCPASQGDEPRRAEGAHTHGAAIMAVLFAMRGRNDTSVCHAEWLRGRETPPALRATSPARRRSFPFRLVADSFRPLELGVSGLWNWVFQAFGTGCSRPWNWVFQALELGVSGLETGCFRL